MVHIAQSLVGKVLSSAAMCPPIAGSFSTRYTLKPASARSRLACIPAIPPPTTSTAPTVLPFWLSGEGKLLSMIAFTHSFKSVNWANSTSRLGTFRQHQRQGIDDVAFETQRFDRQTQRVAQHCREIEYRHV